MIPGGKHVFLPFGFSSNIVCMCRKCTSDVVCYLQATSRREFPVQPPWLSWQLKLAALSRNLQYSKAQTPRNLMLCHTNWYECYALPEHAYTLTLCLILLHHSSWICTRLIFYFYTRKMNSSEGSILFWKMSLFISYSFLFIHFPRNDLIHNLLAI